MFSRCIQSHLQSHLASSFIISGQKASHGQEAVKFSRDVQGQSLHFLTVIGTVYYYSAPLQLVLIIYLSLCAIGKVPRSPVYCLWWFGLQYESAELSVLVFCVRVMMLELTLTWGNDLLLARRAWSRRCQMYPRKFIAADFNQRSVLGTRHRNSDACDHAKNCNSAARILPIEWTS